jgi:hypothetical protein
MLLGMAAAASVTSTGTLALATGALADSGAAAHIAPGTWTILGTITELEIPGLPASMVAKIASDPKNAQPRAICVPAQTGSPPPAALFHSLSGECSYESWNIASDKLTAVLTCKAPEGAQGSARVTLNGQIEGDRLTWRAETVAVDATGAMQMRMISDVSATRKDGCND